MINKTSMTETSFHLTKLLFPLTYNVSQEAHMNHPDWCITCPNVQWQGQDCATSKMNADPLKCGICKIFPRESI